jgi:hypothetical protein
LINLFSQLLGKGVFMRILCFILCLCLPQVAFAKKVKVSSISWGGATSPNSLTPADDGNIGFNLTTKISFDAGWTVGKAKLVPYATLYTQGDSLGYVYNSKDKITVGIVLRHKVKRHGNLSFGVKYDYDYRALSGIVYSGFGLTADYGLYRSRKRENGDRVILSGWSNLRYPGSMAPRDRANLIGQGQFTLARERKLGKSKFSAAGFTAFGLYGDTDNNEYNNKVQLDFGIRAKRKIKNTNVTLSVKYRIDHRFKSENTYSGVIVGLSWLTISKPKSGVKVERNKAKGWLRRLIRVDT